MGVMGVMVWWRESARRDVVAEAGGVDVGKENTGECSGPGIAPSRLAGKHGRITGSLLSRTSSYLPPEPAFDPPSGHSTEPIPILGLLATMCVSCRQSLTLFFSYDIELLRYVVMN